MLQSRIVYGGLYSTIYVITKALYHLISTCPTHYDIYMYTGVHNTTAVVMLCMQQCHMLHGCTKCCTCISMQFKINNYD